MEETKKPIFAPNPDTDILEKILRENMDGNVVSYETLSKSIGRDVQRAGRHILEAARRRLEREGHYFTCIHNEGIRLLDDTEKPDYLSSQIKGLNRKAKRAARRGVVTNLDKLDTAQKEKHVLCMSRIALAQLTTSKKAEEKLKTLGTNTTHPTTAMLDALKK